MANNLLNRTMHIVTILYIIQDGDNVVQSSCRSGSIYIDNNTQSQGEMEWGVIGMTRKCNNVGLMRRYRGVVTKK